MIAIRVRPTATAVPFRVLTCSGGSLALGPVAAVEAARLVVGRVRGRGQLAVAALARDPCLAVELAGGGGAEIADRDVDDSIGDLEGSEDPLLDSEQALMLVLGAGRLHEREHLDLVELMDAKDAAGVLAGGAGLAAKAGGDPRVTQRQVATVEDLARVQAGEGDLGGADEEELVLFDLVDHLPLAGEEPGPVQRLLADEHRGHHRGEPLLAGDLDGEPDERQLQQDEIPDQIGEAGAGEGGGLLGLDQAEGPAEVEVVAGLEAEGRVLTDLAHDDRVLVGLAIGRVGVRRVGDRGGELVASGNHLGELRLELLDPGGDVAHRGDCSRRRPPLPASLRRSHRTRRCAPRAGPPPRAAARAGGRRARAGDRGPPPPRPGPARRVRAPGPRGCAVGRAGG